MEATPQQEEWVRMHTIASDLRIALDGWPVGTIEAHADEWKGITVGIMLGARLSDVGNAENGPKLNVEPVRFMELVHWKDHWDLDVYDLTDMPDDPDEYDPGEWETPKVTLRIVNLEGIESMHRLVVKTVVSIVKALGLRYES